jgi:transketolase
MRLGKAGEPIIHNQLNHIEVGTGIPVIKGTQKALFTTGAMLKYGYDYILNNKLNWSLYSFPIIKPLNHHLLKSLIVQYKEILTLEEHQKSCGFGSAILEVVNDMIEEKLIDSSPLIKRIAIPDKFIAIAGTQDFIRSKAGLIL